MKKRRIGIDARLLYQTGVGVYLRNLLFNLIKIKDENVEIVIFAQKKDWDKFVFEYKLSTAHLEFRTCDVSWHSFSEQIVFLWQLYSAKLDLVHFPYLSWPVLYFGPFVATIHDTILLKHATGRATTLPVVWYYIKSLIFRFVLWQQVLRAKAIFIPSKAVAAELEDYYPSAKGKIVVTHEGVDEVFAKSVSRKPDNFQFSEKSYFLYVGNCYPHKNVEMLLEAFQKFKIQNSPLRSTSFEGQAKVKTRQQEISPPSTKSRSRDDEVGVTKSRSRDDEVGVTKSRSPRFISGLHGAPRDEADEPRLVLVGPRSIFADRLKEEYKNLGKDILWLHDAETTELKWLYSNAKALVLPSMAEGFGLPILEAASVNCPLILSDIPVFHEVAGENAVYFDSLSPDSLAAILSSDLNNATSSPAKDDYSFGIMSEITAAYYRK